MAGERYFELRDRLLDCFGRIEELAAESGVSLKDDPDDPRERLARNFRVAALGEINAGKSTLLNALVGAEMCPAGPLPTTREFRHYGYGPAAGERRRGDDWVECPRQHPMLETIELIDSPGTNLPEARIRERLPEVEQADLILVVFPAANTWTAATWDIVSSLSDDALGRTALVVQQADQKQAEDLRVIRGHMTDLCLKKVGRELPILCVAAKLALEAKRAPATSREGWAASGFSAFEDFLNDRVCRAPEREHLIMRASQQAGRVLREVEDGLDRQRRSMDDDGWFLSGLEREVEKLRDLVLEESEKARAAAGRFFRGEVDDQCRALESRLRFLPTLKRVLFGDPSASEVEAEFGARLQEAVQAFGRIEVDRLMEECHGHWSEVRPRVVERMGMDPGEHPPMDDSKAGLTDRFTRRLLRGLAGVTTALRVRARLDPILRRRNLLLKVLLAAALAVVTAAGVCGMTGRDASGLVLLAVAAVLAVVAGLHAWVSARRITAAFRDELGDSETTFESALEADHGEAVRFLFREYGNGLIGVRRQLADRKASLEPRSKRWDALFLELKMIEQDMGT